MKQHQILYHKLRRNTFSIVLFLFLFLITTESYSQLDTNSNFEYFAQNISKPNAALADTVKLQNADSLNVLSKTDSSESKYYTFDEFKYADTHLYTLTGDLPLKTTEIRPLEFGLFVGTYATFMVAQHILQMETIWKEQTDFKIMEDGPYALYADKAGHFFGVYLTSYAMREGFLVSGLSYEAATIWGLVGGLSYSTYVEILDGFGKDWGFCPSDFYMDVAGGAFFLGQHYFPFLQNFTPKFSYVPPKWHKERDRVPSEMFIDNYSAHTLWLSVNVHNLLPESLQKYWVDGIDIAFGYAARHLADTINTSYRPGPDDVVIDGYFGSPRYIIALDYNLVKLLPEGGKFWNWMRQTLNFFKLPSPAVEFSKSKTRFYLLYPFQISF